MIQCLIRIHDTHIRAECHLSNKEDCKPLETFLDNRHTSKKTLNTFLPRRDFHTFFSLHPYITKVRCGLSLKRINRSSLGWEYAWEGSNATEEKKKVKKYPESIEGLGPVARIMVSALRETRA